MKRIRITIKHNPADPADDLRVAARVRRDLWGHAPVEIDPDSPVHGTNRDADRNAYFEFATNYPDEVEKVLRDYGHMPRVVTAVVNDEFGMECLSCGSLSDELFVVCPNCHLRDISPCPHCNQEVARLSYLPIFGDIFKCPMCNHRVRLSFHDPMFNSDDEYNQPLVNVESAEAPVHGV